MLNQQQQKPLQPPPTSLLSDTPKKLSISIETNFAMPQTPINKTPSSTKSSFMPYSQGLSVSSHQLSSLGLTSISNQNESLTGGTGTASTLKKKITGKKPTTTSNKSRFIQIIESNMCGKHIMLFFVGIKSQKCQIRHSRKKNNKNISKCFCRKKLINIANCDIDLSLLM